MGKSKILLVGGGGHCRSVLDCLLRSGAYDEIGAVDRDPEAGLSLLGIPVIGKDDDLPALFAAGWTNAAVTLGSVGHPDRRRALFRRLKEIGFALPVITDDSCVIGCEVTLGEGTFVGKRAVVNCRVQTGQCAIINTGAIVEHDCRIGSFAHISPGAVLCGEVHIGENTHIGAGSVVRQQIEIGRDSIVGAGSVVVRNIPDGSKAYGNPCREVSAP